MTTLLPLLQAIAADQSAQSRGLDLGVVTDVFSNEGGNGDSQPSVNVRVRGSALELHRVPVAVGRIGLSVLPRIDDLVLVGYVGGDLNGAVVLGSLYDEQNDAPDAAPDEIVYHVPDAGQTGVRRVELILDEDKLVTIEEAHVEVKMGGSSLRIDADGDIVLSAAGSIRLDAGGDIELAAQGDIKGSGSNLGFEAQANAELKGSAMAAIESSGTTKVSGSMVTVGGLVQFSAS
ncbi:MAG: phage baseplate assembly protein V [Actinomycetota bacterium]